MTKEQKNAIPKTSVLVHQLHLQLAMDKSSIDRMDSPMFNVLSVRDRQRFLARLNKRVNNIEAILKTLPVRI
jgi:hypothetical protein